MTKRSLWLGLASPLMLAAGLFGGAAHAQTVAPPAVRSNIDERGVDVLTGKVQIATPVLSVGAGAGVLAFQRYYDSSPYAWRDNLAGGINLVSGTYTVTLMGASVRFTQSGGVFSEVEARGAQLAFNSSANTYTFVSAGGVTAVFDKALGSGSPTEANEGRVITMTAPGGTVTTFSYFGLTFGALTHYRLQSVRNSFGYQIHFEYQSNAGDATGFTLLKATALNNAVDFCDPTANGCTGLTQAWPTLNFAVDGTALLVTDALSRTTRYSFTGGELMSIRRPTGATDNITLTYAAGRVATVGDGAGMWSYGFGDVGDVRTTTITDPSSHQTVVTSSIAQKTLLTFRDGLSRTTTYAYDSANRVERVTRPEGDYVTYARDSRGNVTQQRQVAKSGSGLAEIVTSASFPSACTNPKTCNQPDYVIDARGYQTDFTYDAAHGGVLTATSPAPSGGGVRPQTRYGYTAVSAAYKTSASGGLQSGPAQSLVTSIAACATLSSCEIGADRADEVRTTIGYTGSNNLLPTAITSGSGDGALSATETLTYDAVGNLLTIDGPLSGSADTTRHRYDLARQKTGVIGPDPDGAGALKHRAVRIAYNLDGQATTLEQGTVNSQSDGDWAGFSTLQQVAVVHDAVGRTIKESFVAGGVTHTVMQYSYDNESRLDCVVERMNPAAFSSLPASACTLGAAGGNGADRVMKTLYNAADEATSARMAVGTALEQTTQAMTYTANGQLATFADANGNLTTFEYDGFDRAKKIRYPTASNGSVSSTTDYEEFSFDAASNVITERRRDGATVANMYDNLSRRTALDAPSGNDDIATTWDNFGRPKTEAHGGQTLTYAYDALDRLMEVTGPLGATGYQYDLAGRRTRLTWADGFYVTYDVNLADEVTAIRENGDASGVGVLATYAYDNLGRRTAIARGNGVATTFAWDAASRLQTLTQDLAATAHDQTFGFGYNGADQALSRTSSNASYAAPTPSASTKTYASNGLNQYSAVGGVNFTHDARGNLTSDGAKTFGYDVHNRLVSATGGAAFAYDPAGRLFQSSLAGATTRFAYDGADMIAEHDGSSGGSNALKRRYVHGPGQDEPLVWYEGAGTADRRWLASDRLGSVIAVTDAAGAATAINTYDEYGVPGASNLGRFGYTGQTLLPEAAVYYYKARVYAPALGRFLQTDPILYDGGANLYAYVGNDPVNATDSWGLQVDCIAGSQTTHPQCKTEDYIEVTAPRRPRSNINAPGSIRVDAGGNGGRDRGRGRGRGGGGGGGGVLTPLEPDRSYRCSDEPIYDTLRDINDLSSSVTLIGDGVTVYGAVIAVGGFVVTGGNPAGAVPGVLIAISGAGISGVGTTAQALSGLPLFATGADTRRGFTSIASFGVGHYFRNIPAIVHPPFGRAIDAAINAGYNRAGVPECTGGRR